MAVKYNVVYPIANAVVKVKQITNYAFEFNGSDNYLDNGNILDLEDEYIYTAKYIGTTSQNAYEAIFGMYEGWGKEVFIRYFSADNKISTRFANAGSFSLTPDWNVKEFHKYKLNKTGLYVDDELKLSFTADYVGSGITRTVYDGAMHEEIVKHIGNWQIRDKQITSNGITKTTLFREGSGSQVKDTAGNSYTVNGTVLESQWIDLDNNAVQLPNILNDDGDFLSSTNGVGDGWYVNFGTVSGESVANKIQSYTPLVDYGGILHNVSLISGHKYYACGYFKSDADTVHFAENGGYLDDICQGDNVEHFLSFEWTYSSGTVLFTYTVGPTGSSIVDMRKIHLFDLTELQATYPFIDKTWLDSFVQEQVSKGIYINGQKLSYV